VNPTSAGRPGDVACDEVLARYGDYMDGLLTPLEAARLQLHFGVCGSCARYDRIMRRGLELVRDMPEITPSDDFEQRLQHRLYHVDDAASLAPRPVAGAVATFAVAGMLALLAWSPILLSTEDGVAVAAREQEDPVRPAYATAMPAPPELPIPLPVREPLLGAGDLWEPAMAAMAPLSSGDMARILAAFPGPYSPLVVTPPVHGRTVRTVSSEYVD
jgi:hypothetical protein